MPCTRCPDLGLCPHCGMTALPMVKEYTGGKGFVTTEQAIPTRGTLTGPAAFRVTGTPVPQGDPKRKNDALHAWRRKVADVARTARLDHGEMGAFQPASAIIQITSADGDTTRLDEYARAVFDACTHAHLLHDDAQVVDLIISRRPASTLTGGATGVHINIIPGEILGPRARGVVTGLARDDGASEITVHSQPRTQGDKVGRGKKKDPAAPRKSGSRDRSGEWITAVAAAANGLPDLGDEVSVVAGFYIPRWLEPDTIHYGLVNGRDLDKQIRSTMTGLDKALGAGAVVDVVASKRLSENPHGRFLISPGRLLRKGNLEHVVANLDSSATRWSG